VKAIYGLYTEGASAQSAVDRLRAAGVADRDITVLSPEPREDLAFSHMHPRTYMWYFACLGGVIGFSLATALAYISETSWPIVVGGLPIVAWWPNLIIMFELTMLGAITATVLTLLVSGELALSRRGIYDPEVTSGSILVGVENPPDSSLTAFEQALSAPPGARIKKI
jgi:hypothetical protein